MEGAHFFAGDVAIAIRVDLGEILQQALGVGSLRLVEGDLAILIRVHLFQMLGALLLHALFATFFAVLTVGVVAGATVLRACKGGDQEGGQCSDEECFDFHGMYLSECFKIAVGGVFIPNIVSRSGKLQRIVGSLFQKRFAPKTSGSFHGIAPYKCYRCPCAICYRCLWGEPMMIPVFTADIIPDTNLGFLPLTFGLLNSGTKRKRIKAILSQQALSGLFNHRSRPSFVPQLG